MAVDLEEDEVLNQGQNHDSTFESFFEDQMTHELIDDDSLGEFVDRVTSFVSTSTRPIFREASNKSSASSEFNADDGAPTVRMNVSGQRHFIGIH